MLNKFWYYVLSFTWGILLTLAGCLTTAALYICGYRPKSWLYGWYFELNGDWGGLNLGPCILTSKEPSISLRNHEFGHSIQNCIFGPFVLVLVCLPSVVRYWYRIYLTKCKKIPSNELKPYDAAWFEGTTTSLGRKYFFKDWE